MHCGSWHREDRGDQYQLIVVSSFYIAVKAHEKAALSDKQLADLSRGKFTAKQVSDMERKILFTLGWTICPPTIYAWARTFLSTIVLDEKDVDEVLALMNPQIKETVCDPEKMCERPSHAALGILIRTLVENFGVDRKILVEVVRNFVQILGTTRLECKRILISAGIVSKKMASDTEPRKIVVHSNSQG